MLADGHWVRRRMNAGKTWCVVLSLALFGSVAGCDGGERPAGSGVGQTPEATALPPPTPEGPQGVVVDLVNEVDAHALPEGDWEEAAVDQVIYTGGEVWAREASTARVGIEETRVRVAPNTIFTLEEPDADTLQLSLDEGQAWVDVEGLEAGETFQVETPAAVAAVRGTRFGVSVDGDGVTAVSTREGSVWVTGASSTITVTEGTQTTVLPGSAPSAPEPMLPGTQVGWGMAAGNGLDVLLPVVGEMGAFTYTGLTSYPQLSPDGEHFSCVYWVPGAPSSGLVMFDVESGEPFDTTIPGDADGLSFGPDGTRVAYQLWRGGGTQICVSDVDGANASCLGGDAFYDWPVWSPDGQTLLVASDRGIGVVNLYSTPADGSGVLTEVVFEEWNSNWAPAYSADGARIAYLATPPNDTTDAELWVVDADGANALMVFGGIVQKQELAWSPDGSWIAAPGADTVGGGLWLVRPDGSASGAITGTDGLECHEPAWSPTSDGWPLFFTVGDAEQRDLWVAAAPGASGVPFADADWGPLWSSEGTQAVLGFGSGSGRDSQTAVHTFSTEVDFYAPYTVALGLR